MTKNKLRFAAIICITFLVGAAIIATAVVTGLGVAATGVIDTAAIMSGIASITHLAINSKDEDKKKKQP